MSDYKKRDELLRELLQQPTQLNTRIPRWISDEIEEIAGKTKKTKASIITEALAVYLASKGISDPTAEPEKPEPKKSK